MNNKNVTEISPPEGSVGFGTRAAPNKGDSFVCIKQLLTRLWWSNVLVWSALFIISYSHVKAVICFCFPQLDRITFFFLNKFAHLALNLLHSGVKEPEFKTFLGGVRIFSLVWAEINCPKDFKTHWYSLLFSQCSHSARVWLSPEACCLLRAALRAVLTPELPCSLA